MMVRKILAVVAGLAAAFATVWLIQLIGHEVYPPPAGLDINDRVQMEAYVASLSIGPLLFVLASFLLGTLVGIKVACWVAPDSPLRNGLMITAIMLAGTMTNLVMIPHPLWFAITAIVGILLVAWLVIISTAAQTGYHR